MPWYRVDLFVDEVQKGSAAKGATRGPPHQPGQCDILIKKNETSRQKWKLQIFDKLRSTSPDVFEKLIVVSGDVTEDGLGLKDQAQVEEIFKKVTVVFHCAACVRFDMTMKYALTFNTRGTKRVLEFCSKIENLEVNKQTPIFPAALNFNFSL